MKSKYIRAENWRDVHNNDEDADCDEVDILISDIFTQKSSQKKFSLKNCSKKSINKKYLKKNSVDFFKIIEEN